MKITLSPTLPHQGGGLNVELSFYLTLIPPSPVKGEG